MEIKHFFKIIFFVITIVLEIESKEKYPKYLITYRNITFEISNKPYLLEGNERDEHPGKCYLEARKKEWNEGTFYYPPNICQRMTCVDTGTILVEHCGAVTVNESCRLHIKGEDNYPNCCLIFKCKSSDNKGFLYNPLTPYQGALEE